jgi:L-2,4-diaminobutyrate decarboxylase
VTDDGERAAARDWAYDPERFRAEGRRVVDRLADHLAASMRGEPAVIAWRDPAAMAAAWPASFDAAPGAALADLLERLLADAVHQHHPRCFGHQVAAPLPLAALGELCIAILNNGMASYESGPVSSAIERNVARWLASRLGMPGGADGVLTSGGTAANLTALLAARHAALGPSPEGARPALLASAHAHYSVARAAVVMGWGPRAVVPLAVDGAFRVRPDDLAGAVARAEADGRVVIAVVATAGASATGAIDPLEPMAAFCRERGLWLHVDGAHGASAILSAKYAPLLQGIGEADSVVWDAHKLMALPALCSAVLFRRGDASYAPFAQDASYLFSLEDPPGRWFDFGLRNLECTKRMMGVALYLALAVHGTALFDAQISGLFDTARRFADVIRASGDFVVACEPQCNIVCFRHCPAGRELDDGAHARIREELLKGGRFNLTRTELDGKTWLRVAIMNPLTADADLEALLAAVREAAVTGRPSG